MGAVWAFISAHVTEGLLVAMVAGFTTLRVEQGKARKVQATVAHEVTPNSGSSLKDAVIRIEGAVATMKEDMAGLKTGQARNSERLATLEGAAIVRVRGWRPWSA